MKLILVAIFASCCICFSAGYYGDHLPDKPGQDPLWCESYKSYCKYEAIKVECQHTCNVTTVVEPSWCKDNANLCYQASVQASCPITCVKQIHGNWGEWSAWESCSVSCGQGVQKRHRSCNDPSPSGGGKECDMMDGMNHGMKEEQVRDCTSDKCPIHGGYTDWSSYSTCSKTCGAGNQYKYRCCNNPPPMHGGDDCSKLGEPVEMRLCNTNPCPVDGGYSEWSEWDLCTATCGNGTQNRVRTCTNPAPLFGGHNCSTLGEPVETRSCNEQPCPIDGGYSDFSDYSQCSKSCGGGLHYRQRCCNNPSPAFGGKPCILLGPPVEIKTCEEQPCPIDGNWGEWEAFGACSKTCGSDGEKVRTRACDSPAAQHGGKDCPGNATESAECNRTPCPIDGGVSEWGDWSSCSATCGASTKVRGRTCTNPAPANGGADCAGDLVETMNCNVSKCSEYKYGLTELSWDAAEADCVAWGGHLVKFEDEAEMDVIVGGFIANSVPATTDTYVWIGLNDKAVQSEYRWMDGTTPTFLPWGNGEPSHITHNCVGLNLGTKTWWDRNCPTNYRYVCEK